MPKYPMLINAINSSVWAIMPEKMEVIMSFLSHRLKNIPVMSQDVHHEIDAAAQRSTANISGSIAILPIVGTVTQRMDLMSALSGGTSTNMVGKEFDRLVNDSDIAAIILEVDSPGGSVYGLEELSTKIRNARGKKPIVAIANSLMASAAYYIGSAADEIVVTPGGEVGSIGTIAIHLDTSAADEKDGLKYTIVKAGDFKAIGNSYEPLDDVAKEYLQQMVDQYYSMFISAVSANRGISEDDVKKNYGQGKVFVANEAVKQGLADRVETLDQTIARVSRRIRYGK